MNNKPKLVAILLAIPVFILLFVLYRQNVVGNDAVVTGSKQETEPNREACIQAMQARSQKNKEAEKKVDKMIHDCVVSEVESAGYEYIDCINNHELPECDSTDRYNADINAWGVCEDKYNRNAELVKAGYTSGFAPLEECIGIL